MFKSINIIGYGYVGGAIGYLCEKNHIPVNICDTQSKSGTFNYFTQDIEALVKYSENENEINYYFIAVPTPSNADGECDISIIHTVLTKLNAYVSKKTRVIIKSTMVPGSCSELNNQYNNFELILCPEFLREATYKDDMYDASFVLLGLPPNYDMEKYSELLSLFRRLYVHNYNIEIIMKSYEECELFKYTLNTFFATKITFFNEIHEICEVMDVDYQKLKVLFKLDNRVGDYGTMVPGPGNEFYGYHLKCLPKEVKGMIKLQEKLGLTSEFMSCVNNRNNYFKNKKVEN
jgi:UDPglucose 6-dehydrogenase